MSAIDSAAAIQTGCHVLHGRNWCANATKYPTDWACPDGNPYALVSLYCGQIATIAVSNAVLG